MGQFVGNSCTHSVVRTDHPEPIGVPGRHLHVVSAHHHRDPAVVCQVLQQLEDTDPPGRVEEGGGFVEQQQSGGLRDGAGDHHPLPLPVG